MFAAPCHRQIADLALCVVAVEGDGANGAFDHVGGDLDATVADEAAKAVTVFGDTGECFAKG